MLWDRKEVDKLLLNLYWAWLCDTFWCSIGLVVRYLPDVLLGRCLGYVVCHRGLWLSQIQYQLRSVCLILCVTLPK